MFLPKTWLRLKHGFELCREEGTFRALVAYKELENQRRSRPQFKSSPRNQADQGVTVDAVAPLGFQPNGRVKALCSRRPHASPRPIQGAYSDGAAWCTMV